MRIFQVPEEEIGSMVNDHKIRGAKYSKARSTTVSADGSIRQDGF